MRTWHTTLAAGVLGTLVAVAVPGQAQQVTMGTRFHTLSDSFFENSSINWSGTYLWPINNTKNTQFGNVFPGVTFSFGAPNLAKPQFGSPDPSAGLSTNFAILNKNTQIAFGINYGQGYKQSAITQVPSVTFMNGQTGYVSDTSQTPFVISVVPVVGAFPVAPQPQFPQNSFDSSGIDPRVPAMFQAHADAQTQAQGGGPVPPPQQNPNNPAPQRDKKVTKAPAPPDAAEVAEQRLTAAQESTAGRPALSVAEAKRLHQQELAAANGEMAALMERARALEEDGKPSVAKIYYERIAKHATGELQQQARTRLYEIQSSEKPQ